MQENNPYSDPDNPIWHSYKGVHKQGEPFPSIQDLNRRLAAVVKFAKENIKDGR